MGSRRGQVVGIALLVVVIGLIVGVVNFVFDPARLTPKLAAAIARATGLTLMVYGKIGIGYSLNPTITLENVVLAGPPGEAGEFSRPEVVKIARIEVTLALAQLFQRRIEIDYIAVVRPDILLETDRAGHANWRPARGEPVPEPAPSGQFLAGGGGIPAPSFTVSANDVVLTDGRVTWDDATSGRRRSVEIHQLTVTRSENGGSEAIGTLDFEGQKIAMSARTGQLADLRTASVDAPWPMSLTLDAVGLQVTIDGKLARPLEGRGYTIALDGKFPDQSILRPFLGDWPVAALKDLTVHAEVTDGGGDASPLTGFDLTARSVDFAGAMRGWKLEDLRVRGRGADPIQVGARLSRPGYDTGLAGELGDLAWLAHGATGPLRVALDWNAASARGSVKGTVEAPLSLSGFALDMALDMPDPTLVMDGAPPGVKSVLFKGNFIDAPGLSSFKVTSSAGDLAGTFTVAPHPRVSVTGRVVSENLDLGAFETPPPTIPGPGRIPKRTSDTPVPMSIGPVIPATALPFDLMRSIDADVKFVFAKVSLDGDDTGGIDASLSLKDGVLHVDPITAANPAMHASLEADATKTPPPVHLNLDAPAVLLRPALAMLGLPPVATGVAEVRADVAGAGESLRAIAGSLDGWVGIAVPKGQLDAKMIDGWLDRVHAPKTGGGDTADLRCFAIRADLKAGIATLAAAALNSAPLIAEGDGEIDMARETMTLGLRPRVRAGGREVVVPLRVSGPWRSLSVRADLSPKALGASGLIGLVLGEKEPAPLGDPCPDALARARDQTVPLKDGQK